MWGMETTLPAGLCGAVATNQTTSRPDRSAARAGLLLRMGRRIRSGSSVTAWLQPAAHPAQTVWPRQLLLASKAIPTKLTVARASLAAPKLIFASLLQHQREACSRAFQHELASW